MFSMCTFSLFLYFLYNFVLQSICEFVFVFSIILIKCIELWNEYF